MNTFADYHVAFNRGDDRWEHEVFEIEEDDLSPEWVADNGDRMWDSGEELEPEMVYTIVRDEAHFDQIMNYLVCERGFSSNGIDWHDFEYEIYKGRKPVLYYWLNDVDDLIYGDIKYAISDGERRIDLFPMAEIPEELFRL